MATWSNNKAADKTCAPCFSTYEITYHQVPVKDTDSFSCHVCRLELDSWKSTRYPTYTLKIRAQWPKTAPTT